MAAEKGKPSKIGLIGLAVMGQNLALNIASRGHRVSVFNRTAQKTKDFFESRCADKDVLPTYELEEFVKSLERPRKVFLMVKAGAAVDSTIKQLTPLLDKGDIIIDGGNSLYTDTERREKELASLGLHFLGVGVSGGEYGALHGPSIMPGGSFEAYKEVEEILTSISAKVDDEPCCSYIGRGGAGHFVKMVHNGIEYGDMELIAEAYFLLKAVLGANNKKIAAIFEKWNEGPLSSYLIEITAQIFKKKDEDTGGDLIDSILDKAGQKGTGRWTVKNAVELGVAIPTITAALQGRVISSLKAERQKAAEILASQRDNFKGDEEDFIEGVHAALYASKICSYAQGMALLQVASREYDWKLDLSAIARLWRDGCIIRARFLDDVSRAFEKEPHLDNLLVSDYFSREILSVEKKWRSMVGQAIAHSVPAIAFSASLSYFDAYRCARLPANLIQAQRDFFGAHTYQRVDREGSFHTEWS